MESLDTFARAARSKSRSASDAPRPESDAELVAATVAGDDSAFEALMRCHNQNLYRLARSIVQDEHEALDVVQESYVRAYLHLDDFRGPDGFGTWLYTITRHEALASLRRGRRRRAATEEEMEAMADKADAAPEASPEGLLARTQIRDALDAAVDQLPEPLRTVFVLRAVNGSSIRDTALIVGINEQTVKTRLFRARRLLRRRIDAWLTCADAHIYEFGGARCDRVTRAVLLRLASHGRRREPPS